MMNKSNEQPTIKDEQTTIKNEQDLTKKEQTTIDADEESCSNEESKPGLSSNKKIAAGVAAAALLATSSPAHAGIGSILNDMKEKLSKGVEEVLGPIMSIVGVVIGQFVGESGAATTAAATKVADSEANYKNEVDNKKTFAATAPPPDQCISDELGAEAGIQENNSAIISGVLSKKSSDASTNNSDESALHALTKIGQRYTSPTAASKGLKNAHIRSSTITGQDKIETAEQRKAALDFVDTIAVGTQQKIKLSDADAAGTAPAQRRYYMAVSSQQARLEIAKSPFYSAIANRMVAPGDETSKFSIMEQEVARTYGGNSDWRNQIANFADPTPLVAELNKQLAFSNSLQVNQLKIMEQQSLVMSTLLMEVMTSNQRIQQRKSAS